jgi:predicted ATPase
VPVPKRLGEATPFAAVLGDVQDRVQDLQVVERDIAALGWEAALDATILSLGEFHVRSIA